MLNCHDVAKYFLTKGDAEEGEAITNLKLQKLVYYAQSASLALYDAPLFMEPVEAWKFGPVVPELYHSFKRHGSEPLPWVEDFELERYSLRERKLLDDVYAFFGQFAAWKLRDMTHEETPWLEASPNQGVISHDAMRDYFRTHWGDEMRDAVGDTDDTFRELLDARWEPTSSTLDAACRYKQGRVVGDVYVSKAV